MKTYYKVIWGTEQAQTCKTKTEAIKIASELLDEYETVTIEKKSL